MKKMNDGLNDEIAAAKKAKEERERLLKEAREAIDDDQSERDFMM